MGADLLLSWAAIDQTEAPDWDAAAAAVEAFDPRLVVDLDFADDVGLADLDGGRSDPRDAVTEALAEARRAIEQGSREMFTIEVRGLNIYVAGGMNSGENPTELTDTFDLLIDAGIFAAAGFQTGK